MQKFVKDYLNELTRRKKRRREAAIAVVLLAVLVIGGVASILERYGVAMTAPAKCGLEEHKHSEDCYEEILICGREEGNSHTHEDACYTAESALICGQEEGGHSHGDECYETESASVLICGQEEGENHSHGDECYETESASVLICGQEEEGGHSHEDACYTETKVLICGEEEDSHIHSDACYEEKLSCEKEEHEHNDICYTDGQPEARPEDMEEDPEQWEEQYAEVHWKGVWGEDLVTAAKKQIGYEEKVVILEDGSEKTYTRYGHFSDDKYLENWDAAFVNFCMHYAGLEDAGVFADETDTEEWLSEFEKTREENKDYLTSKGDYTPESGDLVFLQEDGEERQMGIVSSYDNETGEIGVIQGNSGGKVEENIYDEADNAIDGYLKVSELEDDYKNEESETVFFSEGVQQQISDIPAFAGTVPIDGSAEGKMVLELRYGQDKKHHDELDAQVQSPHYEMVGYFDLYSKDIEGDLKLSELTVTIHIPKEYIDKDGIKFEKLPSTIEHEISEVKENGDYYDISIVFPEYQQTGQMQYQFSMRYLGGIVPEDYELKVYATISCNEKEGDTAENIYKPTYELPRFEKYVNTNQYDSMSEDYTRVSASVDENGMIVDSGYVSFWYKMGGDPILEPDGCFYREYDQITLTDTLPTYEKYVTDSDGKIIYDENGEPKTETATAVFDPEVNPDWELSEDGKTVSRVIETTQSCLIPAKPGEDGRHWRAAVDLQKQIEKAELKLQFPGCVIDEETNDGFLKKDLLNKVEADCHPHNPSAGETNDVLKDDLYFTLTTQPVGAGFGKSNSSNVIMDTQTMRSGLYRWEIKLENEESVIPLSNIKLTDYELDERLKIHTLWLETEGKDAYKAAKRIDRIVAVTYEGTQDTYTSDQFLDRPYDYGFGWYQELVLDSEKEYKSFTIYMKDDCVLNLREKVRVGVYSTFRKPEEKHYINEGKDGNKNIYHNGAKAEYLVQNEDYEAVSGNQFSLIDTRENISIYKKLSYGNSAELGSENIFWEINIVGALADGKSYDDMFVMDLLPEPFELPKNKEGKSEISYGVGGQYIQESLVIDNYKNTGRTAVIFYLNVNEVRKVLDASDGEKGRCLFTFKTSVPADARVGLFENEAWLYSKDFDRITTQSCAADKYDLDDDGDKEEEIRMSKASCTIKSPAGIYAEKFIAPFNIELWRTKGLFLSVGDKFRYKLSVINAADGNHKDLIVYDVLPRIGDRNISSTAGRGSEYTVKLSEKIGPLEGYQVYYTDSEEVYQKSMTEIFGETSGVEWLEEGAVNAELLERITAFKIVADEGTVIPSKGRAEFVIPSKVVDTLDGSSYEILYKKHNEDRESGTATYLTSTNSFGYCVGTFSGNYLESNYVNAQIPFAGFTIKKVDAGDTEKALSGAEFKLEKLQTADAGASAEEGVPEGTWEIVKENVTTGADGILSFRDLTEGTYRLTETKSPAGYNLNPEPIRVEICLNREYMEYTVRIEENDHAGNNKDPFLITNQISYELPSTGGSGTLGYRIGGILLMIIAGMMILYKKKSVNTQIAKDIIKSRQSL